MTSRQDFSIEVLDTLSGVQAIQPIWDHIVSRSDGYVSFLASQWFLNVCRIFNLSPLVVVAKRSNQIVGILPLAKDPDRGPNTFIFPKDSLAENLDLICPVDEPDVCRELIVGAASSLPKNSTILFRNIRKTSQVVRAISSAEEDGFELEYDIETSLIVPYLDTSTGWETYLAQKSANFRKDVKRTRRKIEEHGFALRKATTQELSNVSLVKLFLEFHLQSCPENSILGSVQARQFVQETFPIFLRNGAMDVHVMTSSHGKIVGVYLDVRGHHGNQLAYQHGYDPSLKNLAPGKALCLAAIESACRQNIKKYDLGRTSHTWKERIRTHHEFAYTLTLQT